MNAVRPSMSDQTRIRLLDLWRGEETFGRPLGCVTTSFTFDAEFFEEQCLARFLSIQSNPNETATAYLIEREEKLAECFACVLVDSKHVAADRSLRWHMLPVTIPTGGVLHAKLTLLLWEKRIRLMIGSANLSEPAYRRNQEVIAALDFSEDANPAPDVLSQCVAFLHQIRSFAPGFASKSAGPQAALANFLTSVERRARSLPSAKRTKDGCFLVPLLPDLQEDQNKHKGRASIVDQLRTRWPGPSPDHAWVLSPFFDEDHIASATAEAFASLLTIRGPRRLHFVAPGRTLPDGSVQIDAPEELRTSPHRSLQHKFSFVPQKVKIEGSDEERPLHAKSIWLERGTQALYMLGSSNFTAAGLGLHKRHNIELNLAYLIRDSGSRFGRLCAHSWPQDIELDDLDQVRFLREGGLDSGDVSAPVLPLAFGLALFCLDAKGARLELDIGNTAPTVFDVRSKTGALLIDGKTWRVRDSQEILVVPWDSKRPPSALDVRWHNEEGMACQAPWIVNVAEPSALPPPDELATLSLTELLEILTSSRPLHQIILDILRRRQRNKRSVKNTEIDPHKKVDTSQFLLRRMRRVAQAIEGMRSRLQLPIASIEALQWRLRGPIGPSALAKRLASDDPDGAAFMITEVAATLRGVDWQLGPGLHQGDIRRHVADTLQELQSLAMHAPAPASLLAYVRETFKEILA